AAQSTAASATAPRRRGARELRCASQRGKGARTKVAKVKSPGCRQKRRRTRTRSKTKMATTTRRTVLQTAAAATTLLAAPFVRGAHAAGKLAVGFWDHWVPGANEPLEKLCRE